MLSNKTSELLRRGYELSSRKQHLVRKKQLIERALENCERELDEIIKTLVVEYLPEVPAPDIELIS